MGTAPTKVFVSYARRDFYFAEQVAVGLRRRHVEAWFDVHQLTPGTDWSASIDRAIEDSDALVLITSRAAMESANVQAEVDRAVELGRPVVTVRCSFLSVPQDPAIPVYDLRRSFGRGLTALADDLVARRWPSGGRRIHLPMAQGPLMVAATAAVGVLFSLVLTMAFISAVVGHVVATGRLAGVVLAGTITILGLTAGVSAYTLAAFLRRRISWRYLRGGLITIPVLVLVAVVRVSDFAGYLTTDPVIWALGGADDEPLGAIPTVLGYVVLVACPAAFLVTEFSAGLYRFLRTGVAPQRIRRRHLGHLPAPPYRAASVRTVRLLAAEVDQAVAERLTKCLTVVGIAAVSDASRDRDLVVVSDATPADWLSRRDIREPVAVVATSIAAPLRGVLGGFQWVDHRRRRLRTLRRLAHELARTDTPAAAGESPVFADVPESLHLLRLPTLVAVTEWMLFCLGVIAAQVGTFGLTRLAVGSWTDAPWLPFLCLAVAPFPFLLARWLRRRQLTMVWLVAAVAVFWTALLVLGVDAVLQQEFPDSRQLGRSTAMIEYLGGTVLVLALAARTLLGWLPRRARFGRSNGPSSRDLGPAPGSWVWLAILLPAMLTAVGSALLYG